VISVRVFQDGAMAREQVFPGAPVTIGRGPECEVVLFDPSVSRAHARVETDPEGRLVLRDLASRNGVRVGAERVGEVLGTPSIRCWIGGVLVEVAALSTDDTQEIRAEDVHDLEQRRTVADHVKYVVLGIAGWIAIQLMDGDFWSPWQQNRAVTLLQNTLGAAAGVPVAAFVLLGVLKAVGRRIRIADTLRAIAIVIVVSVGMEALTFFAYYATTATAFGVVSGLLSGLWTVFMVTYLAGVRRKASRRFRILWATALAVLVLGMTATTHLAARRTGAPAVDHHVQMPLAGLVGPSRPVDRYLARVGEATQAAARAADAVRARQGTD
jgi:hypothetical protein